MMKLFLLLGFYLQLGYPAESVPVEPTTTKSQDDRHKQDNGIGYDSEAAYEIYQTIRSAKKPVTSNQTITYILDALASLNTESNRADQRTQARKLGSNLTSNETLEITPHLRNYALDIISNISYQRDRNLTGKMIGQLKAMYQEEIYIAPINYTQFRMTDTDEQRLLRSLMTNYEKSTRPVIKASEPIELKIGLTLNQIDVDEKNQVLTTLVWLDQEWTDEKLIWNPEHYNNLTVLRVPCRMLWLPDIVLYNSVTDMKGGYMQALAMVSHTGNVFWPPIVKFNGACEIKIKYFPFDDQECKLKLGTWSYDGSQVNLTKRRQGIDFTNYQENGEWILLNSEVKRNVEYYSCCPDSPYIDVTFYVYLQRRTLYYTYNIIIPCVMLSILTLLCFWMKPDSGEKISLGLTILLAFSVFMLLIAENMPSTSVHVPIIGIYITSSMCITAFSVIVGVFVANINHQADGDRQVPYWLHRICHVMSKVTCVKMASYNERHFNIKMLALQSQGGVPCCVSNGPSTTNGSIGSCNNTYVLPSTPKRSASTRRRKSTAAVTRANDMRNRSLSIAEAHLAMNAECRKIDEESGNKLHIAEESSESSDPLLKRLHSIVKHQEELLQKQNTTEDWHLVAIIMDRVLFWFYLLMMLSTTIGCLVIFPLTKHSVEGTSVDGHTPL